MMSETNPNHLHDLESAIRTADAAASASVVSIGRNGRGTGFVVATDRVLTSAHNLRDSTASVTFADARVEQGSVHGADADGDLVVLAVPTGDAPPLTFADATPAVGGVVVSLARGGHRARTTLGFVSGVDRTFDGPRGRVVRGGFEHTAPLARGSSGGPVVDVAGKVLGVNTHRVGEGFYLARTTDAALQARIAELLEGRTMQRRTLGVALAPNKVATELRRAVGLPERAGLLVRGVVDDGPAARAGVLAGDLLVTAAGTELADVDALQAALDAPGIETLALGIVRGVEELTITVTFDAPTP
jgi:S1-C subfamily serine protease